MVVPTLMAGPVLVECLNSLERQSLRDFEVIVVDNSGRGAARRCGAGELAAVLIENPSNVGFGAAINQGFARSRAPWLATLNDDAAAHPDWLAALLEAAGRDPRAGMCASAVLLEAGTLDSAGMLVAADGSSKQRGHGRPPAEFARLEEALLPSGSAALYRRRMLEEIGLFDEDFFLYCEDTDLGLRARWAGWKCLYVPGARVVHRYSHSSGRASPLKAYYVERNRLMVVAKNFPAAMLPAAPFSSLARYFWHLAALLGRRGKAGEFHRQGNHPLQLVWFVLRAHWDLVRRARLILSKRRAIRRSARISASQFRRLAAAHRIRAREVAEL